MTKSKILLYGQDEPLLFSRRLVLKSRGFDVDFTCDVHHLEQALAAAGKDPAKIYLLLLCHSVPGKERHRLVSLTRNDYPRIGILQVVLPMQVSAPGLESNVVDASSGPEVLIAAVDQSLAETAAAASA